METSDHPSGPGVTQYDDSRVHDNTAPVIINKFELPKESPWKQPAVYIAALALIVVLGSEWRRWVALDEMRADFSRQMIAADKRNSDYANHIQEFEDYTFTHVSHTDGILAASGYKIERMKPPPQR